MLNSLKLVDKLENGAEKQDQLVGRKNPLVSRKLLGTIKNADESKSEKTQVLMLQFQLCYIFKTS